MTRIISKIPILNDVIPDRNNSIYTSEEKNYLDYVNKNKAIKYFWLLPIIFSVLFLLMPIIHIILSNPDRIILFLSEEFHNYFKKIFSMILAFSGFTIIMTGINPFSFSKENTSKIMQNRDIQNISAEKIFKGKTAAGINLTIKITAITFIELLILGIIAEYRITNIILFYLIIPIYVLNIKLTFYCWPDKESLRMSESEKNAKNTNKKVIEFIKHNFSDLLLPTVILCCISIPLGETWGRILTYETNMPDFLFSIVILLIVNLFAYQLLRKRVIRNIERIKKKSRSE